MQGEPVPVAVWVDMAKKVEQNGDARRAEMIDRAGLCVHDFRSRASQSPGIGVAQAREAKKPVNARVKSMVDAFLCYSEMWDRRIGND
jgi:hypothetical protein